jgi:hypothetical protein
MGYAERKKKPRILLMVNGNFEKVFRDFIRNFGGRVVPEGDEASADLFLPQDNIVAELKIVQGSSNR